MSERLALVTGANGFVGRPLVEHLKSRGWRVRAALRSIAAGPWDECVAIGDLAQEPNWAGSLRGVDTVFHLAARVHVMRETQADPLDAFLRVNRDATVSLAQASEQASVRRFVYLSSLKVLGDISPHGRPFCDTDQPVPPDAYAQSKLEAETHLLATAKTVEPVILRPPLIYGPRVGANFRRMIDWVARGWPLPLGAIDNRRSLVFVAHLVEALALLAEPHFAIAGRRFLIDDSQPVSTPDLLRAIGRALGKPARLFPFPPAMLKTMLSLAGRGPEAIRLLGSLEVDATPLFEALHWRPALSLDAALRETVAP
ncbi:MAG: NAD-dependent epimerase/dehydratase family protein [Betaproteobacteria bacterium]|nr:NAD-dependent epimerase/dehydratase family protein [Betaproteobacteria bacterium]